VYSLTYIYAITRIAKYLNNNTKRKIISATIVAYSIREDVVSIVSGIV
jgi:hypothetical protein